MRSAFVALVSNGRASVGVGSGAVAISESVGFAVFEAFSAGTTVGVGSEAGTGSSLIVSVTLSGYMVHSFFVTPSMYFIGLPSSFNTSNLWFPSVMLYHHFPSLSITIGFVCSSLESDFIMLSYLDCFHAFVFHGSGVPPISAYEAISEYLMVSSIGSCLIVTGSVFPSNFI